MKNPFGQLWYRAVITGLRHLTWLLFFVVGGPIKVLPHRLRLPAGPAIVIANHKSVFDALIIHYVLANRQARFISKANIMSVPVLGHLMRYLGAFSLDRDRMRAIKETFDQSQGLLEQGEVVAFFPEGTMVKGDMIGPIGGLALKLSIATSVPIFFIGIHGVNRIFPFACLWPKGFKRLTIHVSGPHEYASSDCPLNSEDKAKVIARMREELSILSGYPLAP